MTSLGLTFLGNLVDHSLDWVLAVIGVPVIEALITHELVQETSVGSKA